MQGQLALQHKLTETFSAAKQRNRAFSLRAFARRLELSPASLSEILNGKRRVSRKLAERIVRNLALPPKEGSRILDLFPEKGVRRDSSFFAARGLDHDADRYHFLSEWPHRALLALAKTGDFRPDAEWVSIRLGISHDVARATLERVKRLGLLNAVSEGARSEPVTEPQARTDDELGQLASRKTKSQTLDLAQRGLEREGLEPSKFAAVTLAADPAKLPAALEMIEEFRARLSAFLASGSEQTEVYQLGIQLFRLTVGRPKTSELD